MKVLAHINMILFMVEAGNKYYKISTLEKTVSEVEDPEEIYRQGYWEEFKGELDEEKESIIRSLLRIGG